MSLYFDMTELRRILTDLYQLTGHQCALIDTAHAVKIRYPEKANSFCEYIQSTPEGRARCAACDRAAFQKAQSSRKLYMYRCHAGLTEVCAPIYTTADSNELLGYVMIGHLLDSQLPHATQWMSIYERCGSYIPNIEKLKNDYFQLLPTSRETIVAICNILQISVEHILMKNLIRRSRNDLWLRALYYIEENHSERLLASDIANALSVSLSTLNRCAERNVGMSIGNYILHKRLFMACNLLEKSSDSISEIATKVGIADYNYFSRIFKKKIGISPRAYRKAAQSHASLPEFPDPDIIHQEALQINT